MRTFHVGLRVADLVTLELVQWANGHSDTVTADDLIDAEASR